MIFLTSLISVYLHFIGPLKTTVHSLGVLSIPIVASCKNLEEYNFDSFF